MIYIPPGSSIIGADRVDTRSLGKDFGTKEGRLLENERPAHTIKFKGFYIDKFEVTNKEYKKFIMDTGHKPPPNWSYNLNIQGHVMHPVTVISWFDADDYCKWAGKRLPTEEEWERAARGPDGNVYPWGNKFEQGKANLDKGIALPVGSMPKDISFYGVYDMGGNVTEWTSSWYKPYPGSTMKSKYFGKTHKVVKGGAGTVTGHYVLGIFDSRSSSRAFYKTSGRGSDVGFRCAKDAPALPS